MEIRPTINFGGLASGLDTNSIVEQLIAIERRPKTRLLQRQRVEEARQSALRDVSTRLANLASKATALRDAALWADVQTVESSDSTRVTAARTGGAAAGGYEITVTQLARAHQVTQGSSLASASADDVLHVKVGSGSTVDVSIAAGDSLDTIASKISSTTGIPVYASVVSSKLVLSGQSTGASNTISVTSDGSLATGLGLAESLSALDAQYTLNGTAKTSASNAITDAVAGVTLTLKAKTTSAVTITVGAPGPDTQKVQDAVEAFVEQYNSTVDFIRGKLSEKRIRDATTDDDRAKGVLFGDAGLTQLLTKLRNGVADVFSGRPSDVDQLSEVGLSTGAGAATSDLNQDAVSGKLVLDASKLASVLGTRFSDVKALFTNAAGTYESEGLGQRIDRLVSPYTASGGVLAGRIDAEQSVIDSLKARQTDLDRRLAERERRLRQEFTALETALQRSKSTGDWLSGQLAALL